MSPRRVFEKELEDLRLEMIKMGNQVETLVANTIEAVTEQNKELAKQVIKSDDLIDEMEVEIEKKCVSLITHQQPIARDLRLIMSMLKSVTDMERIGDHCEDICTYSLTLEDGVWTKEIAYKRHIEKMATHVREMLSRTLDNFMQKDLDKLKEICQYDDKIDEEFTKIFKEITIEMSKNSDFVPSGAAYIMIVKYLERIADHITNIAEWLIYNLTGEL
ncbi:phosphate signaling complex protein PhoU [Niameybacter massiliensis]|uniref:phosphate signaling complex protein PhoU n=1 Tax=Niameybacter massiliensis TaxID=1658108 RepID=UPI0006B517F4|nr:phosphate signaling complex protein PhoU [Niameybacter massiliensis]